MATNIWRYFTLRMRDYPWHISIRLANIYSILSSINIYPLLNTVLKKVNKKKLCRQTWYLLFLAMLMETKNIFLPLIWMLKTSIHIIFHFTHTMKALARLFVGSIYWKKHGMLSDDFFFLLTWARSAQVSFCDPSMSGVRRPCVRASVISLNNIPSETAYWILTKLHRNDPWVVLYQSCSNRSSWLHK